MRNIIFLLQDKGKILLQVLSSASCHTWLSDSHISSLESEVVSGDRFAICKLK